LTTAQRNDPLLTTSDIAREVGVRTSAVSNWRKRHAEFPKPAHAPDGGTEVFRLSELNAWLRATRRDEIRLDFSESLWQHVRLGGRGRVGGEMLLQAALAALVLRQRLHAAGEPTTLTAEFVHAVHAQGALQESLERAGLSEYEHAFDALGSVAAEVPELLSAADCIDPAQTVVVIEALLMRWLDAAGMHSSATTISTSLAQLIARIAPHAETVLDPAIGFGSTVVAILNRWATEGGKSAPFVLGQEITDFAWSIVVLRLLAHGVDPFHVRRGNSLLEDADPDHRVELVVAEPPYNQRAWGAERLHLGDPRWRFVVPTDGDATAAWIQHVVHHIAPGGQGIVVVPPGVLFTRGRAADLRRSLVAAGIVDGVIALPRGLATTTGIPLAVLLLRSPAADRAPRPVLFINVNSDEYVTRRTKQTRMLTPAAVDRIAATVQTFREHPDSYEAQPGFAATVLSHTLLAESNVALNPQQWVDRLAAEPDDFTDELANAFDAITRGLADVGRTGDLPSLTVREPDQPSPGLHVRDIALTGAVEVLRPGRLNKGDYVSAGTPVLTQTALNRDGSAPNFDRYVDLETVPGPQVITQPGDVILATIGDRPYAVVDEQGGAILGNNLELLRIRATWLDPHVVAACLSSSQTARAVTGTTIPRVRMRDLTLPAMTAETTAMVGDNLARLRQIEDAAQGLATAAAEARHLVVEAIMAGHDIHEGH
jgi:hypothetical protein